jgi:hypothetical protein
MTKYILSLLSACILGSFFIINPVPALAKGPTLSKAEAMKIADREMDMIGYKRSEWKAQADKNNTVWKKANARRRDSSSPENKQFIEHQEGKLKGHEYWAIRYEHLTLPGAAKKGKGEEVWIFVAKDSRRVLLVILPGS